jgi:hypothetical protein
VTAVAFLVFGAGEHGAIEVKNQRTATCRHFATVARGCDNCRSKFSRPINGRCEVWFAR